jgi:hypothetical protein
MLAAGEYDKAYPEYLRFAEQEDNHLAQFTLGLYHQLGWGTQAVAPDIACDWFERAALGQIPAAAHFAADCYAQGNGRPVDPAKAVDFYQQAAGLGHHLSLCSLGELYIQGRGVDKDPQKGLQLCRQAAENGAIPAYVEVGRYLLEGDETIREPEAAAAWFERVAESSPEAQYYLGRIHRDGIGRPVSPDEARFWFERAASQGYVPAYFETARLYFAASPDYSRQLPPADDLAKAYMWLSATLQRSQETEELQASERMLEQVTAIMPPSWAGTLDDRVADHLKANSN